MSKSERRRSRRLRRSKAGLGLGLLFTAVCLADVQAEPIRWLNAMEVRETSDTRVMSVRLTRPVRVLGYAPTGETRLVEIRLDPRAGPRSDGEVIRDEEQLRVPVSASRWVREVRLEPQSGGVGLLVIRFTRPISYDLESRDSGSAVVLRVRKEGEIVARDATRALSGRAGSADALLDEASAAMRSGAYPQAVALYTKLVEMPDGPYSRTALEYLGLARQRNGQRAHARAEYELYLTRYPDGAGAERVGQRLAALRSSLQSQRRALVKTETRRQAEFDGYGTIATTYQRIESFADLTGAVLNDSSQIFEADLTGLARRGDWDARIRASGYYRYDYLGRDTGRGSRIRRLSLDVRNRRHRLRGVIGRQSGRGSGVLGRFDGARVDIGLTSALDIGGVFGFPQTSSLGNGLDTSRVFGGLRVISQRWLGRIDAEAYLIGQSADGIVDRVGIGGTLRYAGGLGSVLLNLDFDAYYASLNLASVSASLSLTQSTWLNLHADHREVPFLTTRNALIGRGEDSLSTLEASLTDEEIQQLARDRTAQASTITVGVEQQVGAGWRVSGDVTASAMTSTPASGGVRATPATGWEMAYVFQAVGNDLVMAGDTNRISLRFFDGRFYTSYTMLMSSRYPIFENMLLTPLLTIDYRDQHTTRDVLSFRPGLRAQYRYRMLTFEADVGGEWMKAVGSGDARSNPDHLGYTLFLSIRVDI